MTSATLKQPRRSVIARVLNVARRYWRDEQNARRVYRRRVMYLLESTLFPPRLWERYYVRPRQKEMWRETGDLRAFERKVYSQNGEDGILEEILRRINVRRGFFVEFGVESGIECNCARLAFEEHWAGLFIEGDANEFAKLSQRYAGRDGVQCVSAWVTSDNIEEIFDAARVPPDFDVLSIDIDGNDYWVWRAIERWKPRIVVIEYNGAFPPHKRWVMKENRAHQWQRDSYYGASLASLAALGRDKGYVLVGTNTHGVNAFFVRQDLFSYDRFLDPALLYHYSPFGFGWRFSGHPEGTGPAEDI